MDFKDLYIISDMDGTLIGNDHTISQENISAINNFVAKGGTFSLATGRPGYGIARFIPDLDVNGYCIVSNGTVIYDSNKSEVLHCGYLNHNRLIPFLKNMLDKIDDVSIQVYASQGLHVALDTDAIDDYIIRENVPHVMMKLDDMHTIDWNKMLFHSKKYADLTCIEQMVKEEFGEEFELGFSSECYLEIIPLGYTKGDSVKRLRAMQEFDGKKFIALGDHHNDVAMLKEADFSICPTNARELPKSVCSLVADVSNDEHLLAWAIEKIASGEIDF